MRCRQGYRPVSTRAAILYFVLNDLSVIDPMYQFSLSSYIELFNTSIMRSAMQKRRSYKESKEPLIEGVSDELSSRIEEINAYHTYAVYCYGCRGLFERHKLLFSLQICFKLLQQQDKISTEELNFLLRGGTLLDRTSQPANPASEFVDEQQWDNLTELDKAFGDFKGLVRCFQTSLREWKVCHLF